MLHQETNEYGVISIDNTFLNQIIRESLKPYEGKAWKANYKGKTSDIFIKLGNMDALADQVIKESDKGIYIKVYLIVKFGVSLGAVTGSIINNLADVLENDLELKVDNIDIVITAMMMNKNVVKRDIVYSYKDHDEEKQE